VCIKDREHDLGNDMLGRDEIDIVNVPHILQLDIPISKLFWCQIKPVSLMSDVVVLAENAS
jgi:hypothetical protein